MTSIPPPHLQASPAPASPPPGLYGTPSPARAIGTPLLTIVGIAVLAWLIRTGLKVLGPVMTGVFLFWLMVTIATGSPFFLL
jgi:hypothetical protein